MSNPFGLDRKDPYNRADESGFQPIEAATGQRIGSWTVNEEVAPKNQVRYFKCTCDCGTVQEISATVLKFRRSNKCALCKKADFKKNRESFFQRKAKIVHS